MNGRGGEHQEVGIQKRQTRFWEGELSPFICFVTGVDEPFVAAAPSACHDTIYD